MGEGSKIEWCDHTFNIAWGCTKISEGCAHCYADTLAHRWGHEVWGYGKPRRIFGEKHWREPLKWNRAAELAGEPARVFCSSMCDVFEDHPSIDQEREKLWPLIRATPWLRWMILTKRPERIHERLPECWEEIRARVWLGTSTENQPTADLRLPQLLAVSPRPAVFFASAEPLLGPVDFGLAHGVPVYREAATVREYAMPARRLIRERPGRGWVRHDGNMQPWLDWLIVGGESGPGARPCDVAWIRSIRDQCAVAGTACFIKQLGACASDPPNGLAGPQLDVSPEAIPLVSKRLRDRKGGDWTEWPADLRVREFPERETR